jgi:tRNA1(Val) A37 N6-methylase TrmN6
METFETKSKTAMIWADALTVDFSAIDYDCVLTSPPYYNVEIYECMTAWKTEEDFYKTFLIPLIDKSRKHIRRNGMVCFNISPAMYKKLIKFGYEASRFELPMLQQKVQGKDKADKLYIW